MIDMSEEQYRGPEVMHKGQPKGRKVRFKKQGNYPGGFTIKVDHQDFMRRSRKQTEEKETLFLLG